MKKNKIFSILTIICFASIIFSPIALVLLWYFTDWKKKTKFIISGVFTLSLAALFLLYFMLKPSYNTSGMSLPVSTNQGYSDFNTETPVVSKKDDLKENDYKTEAFTGGENSKESESNAFSLPKKVTKQKGTKSNRWIYSLLFFLFMLFIIIWQNIKSSRTKSGYENPYVDTAQYKLPLAEDAKIPMVHFLRLRLKPNEKLLFATETTQKDNEGDFAVTNQRVVIFSKTEFVDFPLSVLTAVTSVSNSTIMLTSGDRKYYILMPESQVKYALAVLRWSYSKYSQN